MIEITNFLHGKQTFCTVEEEDGGDLHCHFKMNLQKFLTLYIFPCIL